VAASPELSKTKKGKLMARLLLETELIRATSSGSYQTESVTLPVIFFSREAEAVRQTQEGDYLVIGYHLYGTKFQSTNSDIRHGVQIVVDKVLQRPTRQDAELYDGLRTR
jgi:hypothetical protein